MRSTKLNHELLQLSPRQFGCWILSCLDTSSRTRANPAWNRLTAYGEAALELTKQGSETESSTCWPQARIQQRAKRECLIR